MAAEVPAKDVLCEAMEYLTKLGSNLRTRSENLREKKIRRDKLNNVLAVQKAANKVLLICELSKKSLENVETGIRKVLNLIDTSQGSSKNGGKTSKPDSKNAESNTKYYYIEYRSRKLKIKKRISLKHYTSVRVMAKCMPKSMIDNYPVHYDCKLYRLRQREANILRGDSDNYTEKDVQENSTSVQHTELVTNSQSQDGDMLIISIPDTPLSKLVCFSEDLNDKNFHTQENDLSISESNITDEKKESNESPEHRGKVKRRKSSEESSKERDSKNSNEQSLRKTKTKEIEKNNKSERKTSEIDTKRSSLEASKEKHRKISEKSYKSEDENQKIKKSRVVEYSSDDEKNTEAGKKTTTENIEESSSQINISDDDVNEIEENNKSELKKSKDNEKRSRLEASKRKDRKSSETSYKSEDEKKKKKKLRVVIDSSDDDKNTDAGEQTTENIESISSQINISDDDDSFHKPYIKRRKLSVSSDEKISDETQTEGAKNKIGLESTDENNSNKEQNGNNEDKKPMIKCVSLTKLLKPDILEKKTHLISNKPATKPKDTFPNKHKTTLHKKNEANKDKIETEKLTRREREEQEYWAIKRKEVDSFKSKTFVINLARLPELSIDYLTKLSLRRVTQGGITICEIPDNNPVSGNLFAAETYSVTKCARKDGETLVSHTKKKNGSTSKSINKNKSDDELIAEANKVKKSLLHESDSNDDVMEHVGAKSAKEDNVKNALLKDSDSENKNSDAESQTHSNNEKEDKSSVTARAQKAKTALCNESSSESDKSEFNKATAQAKKVKNKLNDSENKDKSETTQTEKGKKSISVESDSNSKNKSTPQIAQGEKVKKKTINDSESDKNISDTDQANNVNNTTFKLSGSESENNITIPKSDSLLESTNNESLTINTSTTTKSKRDESDSEKDSDRNEKVDNSNEEKEHDNSKEKNDQNLSELQRNEKTPDKESSLGDSDDKTKTPLSQRLTPQSKKKRIRESVHAKKMLLTYSSSDTEDEQLKNALKEIKDELLHGSEEERSAKKKEQKRYSKESSPSSSAEDIISKVKRKISYDSSSSTEKRIKRKSKRQCRKRASSDSTKDDKSDNSKSSSSKMVRSKLKPGSSSSQNSDAPDSNDKDVDGLTNMNTLNKPKSRRRNSTASESTEESSLARTRSRRSKVKPTGLICQEMLKAETSSDAVSESAEDNEDEADLPPVTVPSFNGGVEHIVKEDLLGESDSSASNEESANKDDSDSEEKLNARRRKANAISSDSEVGSSRKKDADVKLSDFEDSDDSEPTNRTKRKKKATDSDASVGSKSSNEGGKKKRRRIKSVKDSDVSGSDSENEGRNKHGRKNIRKVMGKNQLEEATKKAAREEKERIARIAERQKMYNNLEFDESGKPDEVILDKVILDFDPETKEPLIEVDRGLVKKLKPHQANGIKFMWNACFESVKRIKKDVGSGCILAHCMGLGKTLQVVSLTHTLLTHGDLTKVNRVLVVCPLSTVLNWVNEFKMWLKYAETEYEVDIYELSRYKQNSERSFQLSQWFQHGGVCVLGYEMFRNLSADNVKKFKKKMLKNFQEALVDPGPDLVVCDEGHLLKNEKTSLSQSMNRVRTLRRIVLTGTPLQNNLKEYYCMVQFVKPNLLGKYNEYLNRFVNPITNGQYTDSTEHDIKIMKRRSHVLHKMLDGAVQRRDYGVLAPFLPPKHEYVLFITLSEVQTKLYQHYLDNYSRRPLPGKSSGFLFPDFQSLQRIWTHPLVLKYNSERYEIMQQKKRDKEEEDSEGSLVDFIDDDSTPNESSTEDSSDDLSDLSDDSRKKSKKKKSKKNKDKEAKGEGAQGRARRGTRANPKVGEEEEEEDADIVEVKNENPTEWWIKLVEDEVLDDLRNSHKLVLLFDILRQCETIGDKILVFSQSLYSLDLIEHFLSKVDEATQEGRIDEKLGGHVGSWSQGIDYFRLDGSTSCENRSIWCKNFNREDNPRARLFLISTRAGGLGINLVAANRVVIFDVSWNPSHDVQSIFRVYRFGQKKPCYVYRFLAMGTMEEKIYERQVTKQAISKRVIDEQQIDRHYKENDLAELYKFEPQPPVPRPIPPLPKDRLFAEMLREHDAQIYKYHEHDSLLENKEEETLSEEERKAAWEDFENEKNKPPPAPFPAPWPMHNGMVPSLLAQQQQQLAYAALAAIVRKDMPNLNDNQLRDMLPLIYNANPQLMQKMSEIYKYTQPGMMNPAMMNPGVMNAATGGAPGGLAGMGGASGLQYEPPWQRQQQQQQQMRLQQLMQQQNQMGAKFYAGGLGSRDPVAMALQQQRAREIMLGNSAAAARPRGRPPLQPHVPHSADVVDLDSD